MNSCNRIHKVALGFGIGITCAIFMFLFALAGLYGWGGETVSAVMHFYPGYQATWSGAFLGAGLGFIKGFILGFLIAFFYNLFVRCCKYCGYCRHKCPPEPGPKI